MTTPPFPNWTKSGAGASFSEPQACAKRANRFDRQIKIRNILEYAVGAFMTVLIGASAIAAIWKGETLIGVALSLLVVGIFVALWNLRKRASNLTRRPEDPCLVHLRRQYAHQYKALRAVPVWYLGPFIPGIVLLYGAITKNVADVAGVQVALSGIIQPAAITFGIFGLIALANVFAARSLKRQIDQLDAQA